MVEEDCPHIVKVAIEREKTSSCLVGPDFDFIVVSAGNEQWLGLVEVDATDWAVVLFKSVDQRSHTVVP